MSSNIPQRLVNRSLTRLVISELVLDLLYWPVWWYSAGLWFFINYCFTLLQNQYQRVALGVWAKNLFTPMYGQYDIEGRIISFFVRLFQIIVRSLLMLIWIIMDIIFILGWLVLPPYFVYQLLIGLGVL